MKERQSTEEQTKKQEANKNKNNIKEENDIKEDLFKEKQDHVAKEAESTFKINKTCEEDEKPEVMIQ